MKPPTTLVTLAVLLGTSCSSAADGASVITPLIYSGSEVPVETKTFVVGLRETATTATSQCGGLFIGPKHVLTVAHCLFLDYVSIGTHYMSGSTG